METKHMTCDDCKGALDVKQKGNSDNSDTALLTPAWVFPPPEAGVKAGKTKAKREKDEDTTLRDEANPCRRFKTRPLC